MKKSYILLLGLMMGCAGARRSGPDTVHHNITTHGKLFASLFQQRSGEYRALCFQAYNLAQLRLDQAIAGSPDKPLAIVTDIDETVLDNSPYDVKQSLAGEDYEQKSWEEWTALAKADTIPGALSFFKYAASKGVRIFYLTNRAESERVGTLENLKRKGFPDALSEQLILKGDISSKESRRLAIADKYEIALFIGDNLGDFNKLFDKKPENERNSNVAGLAGDFGKKYIVLPNPVYGDWENTLYQFRYNLTKAQKDSVIKSLLKSY